MNTTIRSMRWDAFSDGASSTCSAAWLDFSRNTSPVRRAATMSTSFCRQRWGRTFGSSRQGPGTNLFSGHFIRFADFAPVLRITVPETTLVDCYNDATQPAEAATS